MSNLKDQIIKRESSKPGMRGKVNAKCCECIYDALGGNGTWRQQVAACGAVKCFLHAIRPTTSSETDT